MQHDIQLLQENAQADYQRKVVSPLANSVLSFNAAKQPTTIPLSVFTMPVKFLRLGTVTTAQTINCAADGDIPALLIVTATLSTANVTFTLTNLTDGQKVLFKLRCGNPGRAVTFATNVAGAVVRGSWGTPVNTGLTASAQNQYDCLWENDGGSMKELTIDRYVNYRT